MAIPPSLGKHTPEELQLKIDEAKANIQYVESKLAEMKAHPEIYQKKAEAADIATPKGKDDAKLGDRDKDAKLGDRDKDRDKPAYGLGSSKK